MVNLKTQRLLNLTALAGDDTVHDFGGGPVTGFLMPNDRSS